MTNTVKEVIDAKRGIEQDLKLFLSQRIDAFHAEFQKDVVIESVNISFSEVYEIGTSNCRPVVRDVELSLKFKGA